jgi:uncharacterized membrane protein (DUF4010 family)
MAVAVPLHRGSTQPPAAQSYRNPTNLRAALFFAGFYAAILLLSAWLADTAGARGAYLLAAVSGLSDVDAITLSSLRLLSTGAQNLTVAVTSISVAVGANLVLKALMARTVGGRALGRAIALAFAPSLLALAAGLAALHALA